MVHRGYTGSCIRCHFPANAPRGWNESKTRTQLCHRDVVSHATCVGNLLGLGFVRPCKGNAYTESAGCTVSCDLYGSKLELLAS